MEHIDIRLDDGTGREFDALLKDTLPEDGNLIIATKSKATMAGNPGVIITFRVQLPDGSLKRAQYVTTVKCFLAAAAIIRARHCDEGAVMRTQPELN